MIVVPRAISTVAVRYVGIWLPFVSKAYLCFPASHHKVRQWTILRHIFCGSQKKPRKGPMTALSGLDVTFYHCVMKPQMGIFNLAKLVYSSITYMSKGNPFSITMPVECRSFRTKHSRPPFQSDPSEGQSIAGKLWFMEAYAFFSCSCITTDNISSVLVQFRRTNS